MSRLRALLVAAGVAFALSVAHADPRAVTYTYRVPGFTVTVPAGFVKMPAEHPRAGLLDTFYRGASGETPVLLQFVHLDAEVPQRTLTEREIAELRRSDLVSFTDHREGGRTLGFDIEVLVGTATLPDGTSVLRQAAAVPLDQDSALVVVLAPVDRERESREVMRAVLTSVHGRTSWQTPAQRAAGVLIRAVAIAVVALSLGYALTALAVFRRRDAWHGARSAVLFVTAALWATFGLWLVTPWGGGLWCEASQSFALAALFVGLGLRVRRKGRGMATAASSPEPRPDAPPATP